MTESFDDAFSESLSTSLANRVLIFDSGLGGLSICRELISASAELELLYLSDNEAFPYGEKDPEQLVRRVTTVLEHALKTLAVDILVIACNTASTVALAKLRETLKIPIVGVVPAIKTAAKLSKSKAFGLLATPGTVNSPYTQKLIRQHAPTHDVRCIGSSELVREIEAHTNGADLNIELVASIIEGFDSFDAIDTLVLGCTHFPLIINTFKQLRPHWNWVDSGAAIATRVLSLLDIPALAEAKAAVAAPAPLAARKHNAWFTQRNIDHEALNRYLQTVNFLPAHHLNIS